MRHCFRFILLAIACTGVFLGSCKTEIGEGDKAWNDLVDPYRKTADMGGYSLHYIDIGSGEPLVMIHGFADSTYCWHENIHVLKEAGYRLIIVDQPGLGRSDIPPEPYEYSIENQAKAVVKLTEYLRMRKFNIMGHSMGGGIALYIMVNHPGRIQKAVLIDPVCFHPESFKVMSLPGMEYFSSKLGGRWAVRTGLEDAFYDGDKVDDALVDEYSRPISKPGYYKVLISLEKQFFSPGFEKMTQSYGQIQQPVLIVWGDNDTWMALKFGTRLRDEISGSILSVIKDCGHNPHQECKDKVNPLMVEFLKAEE